MFDGLDEEDDLIIWKFAKDNGFIIVTKDNDFNELSTLRGFPPKVIWLRSGNCTINQIEGILTKHIDVLLEFQGNTKTGVIQIT